MGHFLFVEALALLNLVFGRLVVGEEVFLINRGEVGVVEVVGNLLLAGSH
jgi:hypothetical protein